MTGDLPNGAGGGDPTAPLLRSAESPCSSARLWALSGRAFEVRRGEILGLIGPTAPARPPCSNCLSRLCESSAGRSSSTVRSLLDVPATTRAGRDRPYFPAPRAGQHHDRDRQRDVGTHVRERGGLGDGAQEPDLVHGERRARERLPDDRAARPPRRSRTCGRRAAFRSRSVSRARARAGVRDQALLLDERQAGSTTRRSSAWVSWSGDPRGVRRHDPDGRAPLNFVMRGRPGGRPRLRPHRPRALPPRCGPPRVITGLPGSADMSGLLVLEDVDASYGATTVLRGVSSRVADGGMVALLGPTAPAKDHDAASALQHGGQDPRRDPVRGKCTTGRRPRTSCGSGSATSPRATARSMACRSTRTSRGRARRRGCRDSRHIARILRLLPGAEHPMDPQAGTLSGGEQQMPDSAHADVAAPAACC